MKLSEFDYELPGELVAQEPLPDRSASRMLVLDRKAGTWTDAWFRDLPAHLTSGDCLVINDSKVFPARLFGRKEGYAREVEIFLIRPLDPERRYWSALVRPGRHLHSGVHVELTPRLSAQILETGIRGERRIRLEWRGDLEEELQRLGHVPLPPYIHRPDNASDKERYQTVYAEKHGSVAAPTAGLHFTPEVMSACEAAGAEFAKVTLHVGLGTFQPLTNDVVEENHLHTETWEIPPAAAEAINRAKRCIAVGTTSVRTLETAARQGELRESAAGASDREPCGSSGRKLKVRPGTGETDIFIYPPFEFMATDVLLTNFHLPKSSLLMLASAFTGKDLLLAAYRHAASEKYRFFSYGDCMLIV
jgi:S-adenosylmethionine:tRNA ribosyltransferase-isomerase